MQNNGSTLVSATQLSGQQRRNGCCAISLLSSTLQYRVNQLHRVKKKGGPSGEGTGRSLLYCMYNKLR